MRETIFSLLLLTIFAGSALAAPKMIEMKRGVKFDHKAHQLLVGECKKCHTKTGGGKIEGFGKNWAHGKCKKCHAEVKKGPAACRDCHR